VPSRRRGSRRSESLLLQEVSVRRYSGFDETTG
jgi:hypothetical protein